ncbi:hypothetical protein [uncultured Elizabethkingia sp.]|uniref:hypothetical protein n=1 Tax=uncultured Elizabethkingia sp. TaxID=432638 RepID=UPI002597A206|nr:hypothetical protein [uncultured Elizabethkingia sp.]
MRERIARAGKEIQAKNYQLWQQNNKPIETWSLKVFEQKLDYVHQNPGSGSIAVQEIIAMILEKF